MTAKLVIFLAVMPCLGSSQATQSDAQMFVTADYAWGPDEGHYGPRRYIISAYLPIDDAYYLQDRYMTLRKYDLEANADVLASEKQEILARLRRVKVERGPQQ